MLHERLHPQRMGGVYKTEHAGNPLLVVERELVRLSVRREVELVSDPEEEIEGVLYRLFILLGDKPDGERLHLLAAPRLDYPFGGVYVPQPPLAFLDVRLEYIYRSAVFGVPCAALLDLVLYKDGRTPAVEEVFAYARAEGIKKLPVAEDKTQVQKRGHRLKVVPGQGYALCNGSYAEAEVEPRVPQGVEHLVRQVLYFGRDALLVKEHQVYV